jgi:hypothetical protein
MPHETSFCFMKVRNAWASWAVALWMVVLVVISLKTVLWPRSHSLFPIFADAARNWRAGAELYGGPGPGAAGQDCYRYSPLIAAALTPLTFLPESLGGILWRLINAGVLVAGLMWWCRTGLPRTLGRGQAGVLFLLVLPFAVGSLHNGQANPLVLGLILLAVTAAAEKRWNLAAGCIAGATLLKIYPLAVGLLLVVLYPKSFTGRLVLALALGLALPFLMQEPNYVAGQYRSWLEAVRADDRSGFAPEYAYRNFQLLSRVWLTPLSKKLYLIMEVLAGAGMALLCLAGQQRQWPRRRLLTYLLGLGCCWMTLFGPATESCTYILVAPTLAWAFLEGSWNQKPVWLRFCLGGAYGLLLAACLACWVPGGRWFQGLGVQPLGALLLLVSLVAEPLVPGQIRLAEDMAFGGRL